jgi:hypothetical protein
MDVVQLDFRPDEEFLLADDFWVANDSLLIDDFWLAAEDLRLPCGVLR